MEIVLTSLGNRAWGHGPLFGLFNGRVWGLILMTVGMGHNYPLWTWPVLTVCLFLFRFKSPHRWWDVYRKGNWSAGIGRTLWVIPLGLFAMFLQQSFVPVFLLTLILVPSSYYVAFWLADKVNPPGVDEVFERVAVGELLAGASIGLLCL